MTEPVLDNEVNAAGLRLSRRVKDEWRPDQGWAIYDHGAQRPDLPGWKQKGVMLSAHRVRSAAERKIRQLTKQRGSEHA